MLLKVQENGIRKQSVVLLDGTYYIASDNGREVLVFPASKDGDFYAISLFIEITDPNISNRVLDIAGY